MPIEIGDSTATVRSKINAVLTDAGLNPADNVDTTAATTLLNQVAGLWDVDVTFVNRMPEAEFRESFAALETAGSVKDNWLVDEGQTIVDWSAVSPTFLYDGQLVDGSAVPAGPYRGQAKAVRLGHHPSLSYVDVTGINIDTSDFKNIIIPIFRPSGLGPQTLQQYITKNGYGSWVQFELVVEEADGSGWVDYAIVGATWVGSGTNTGAGPFNQMRIREQDDVARFLYPVGTGDTYIGNIRYRGAAKSLFDIGFDDSRSSLLSTPINGKTCKSILDAYGFKATVYALPRLHGTTGYASNADILSLYQSGWTIGSHTWSHPADTANAGLRLLGPYGYATRSIVSVDIAANTMTASVLHRIPVASSTQDYPVEFTGTNLPAPLIAGTKYFARGTSTTAFTLYATEADALSGANPIDLTTTGTPANFGYRYWGSVNDDTAIYADIIAGIDAVKALGIPDSHARHFALPQGGFDRYVATAVKRANLRSCRGLSPGAVDYIRMPTTKTAGRFEGVYVMPPQLTVPGSVQIDTATDNIARLIAGVDQSKVLGGLNTAYCHQLFAQAIANLEALCAYLKTEQDAGRVTVLNGLVNLITRMKNPST